MIGFGWIWGSSLGLSDALTQTYRHNQILQRPLAHTRSTVQSHDCAQETVNRERRTVNGEHLYVDSETDLSDELEKVFVVRIA